ncbi:MAG: glucose-6-phosphate isomerase family protein [Candidatus Micrarchaeia archaeon]|jgi:glucose-6-phosphate isomerase
MKINASPLELSYENGGKTLLFGKTRLGADVRLLSQMAEVLHDPDFAKKAGGALELYYMHRGVIRKEDADLFQKNAIRYDVTIIPPKMLGREFNKTAGHYHPQASLGKSFPELYQVLAGEANYLLQKRVVRAGKDVGGEIEDAVLVCAKEGDAVLVPPNYGHVTANPSKNETLVMANLVECNFKSDYAPYKALGGAAYFELSSGDFFKNPNYEKVPPLRARPARLFEPTAEAGITNESIYAQFLENPQKFKFLKTP